MEQRYPPARVNHWTEDEVSEEVETGYAKMVDKLLSLNMPLDAITREPEPICVPLTPAAKKLFVPFHNEHATEQVSLDGDLAAAWSKLVGYSLRLALVIEHVRWASGNEWEHPQAISEESMEAGILLAKWFSQETLRIYTILHLSIFENEDRLLAEKIASTYGPVAVRDLMRHLPRQFPEAPAADAALIRLVKAGFGEWEPVKPPGAKGGRPADRKYIPRQSVDKTLGNAGTARFCHSEGAA